MTSINAMRFDHYSGVLMCDEARCWNPEMMKILTPEKMRCVIRPDIQKETGVVAVQGNTGTSTIGDEFMEEVKLRIGEEYDKDCKKAGKKLASFRKMEDLAHFAFEVISGIKRRHIDEGLVGKFGFTGAEFINGSYKKDDKTVEIKDKEVATAAYRQMTWEGRGEDVQGVFLNSQVFAGYDPETGFRAFLLSEIIPVCEAIQECFLAEGSGLDVCDLVWSNNASMRSVPERRGAIDRVEGLVTMLEGLNSAFRVSAGVTGYPKIMYVNGREKDHMARLKEICDWRSKLASEAVFAEMYGFISRETAMKLVEAVIYKDKPFEEVNEALWSAATDRKKMLRFFRGYPA
jgi:hypothetical protein